MKESLKDILIVQELDMKMIRLMRLKSERLKELKNIHSLRKELVEQLKAKEEEIVELKKDVRIHEGKIDEIKERISKLEGQQGKVKKVEEFNALSQEISSAERERTAAEQKLSDVLDKLAMEEDGLTSIQESITSTEESSKAFEVELLESIEKINEEGASLLQEREANIEKTPSDIRKVYEKLLRNKKDRVVVPIENRTCSGCHIVLTAQHENLVRKFERLVFCEHCSRILFWQDSETLETADVSTTKRRRRRSGLTTV